MDLSYATGRKFLLFVVRLPSSYFYPYSLTADLRSVLNFKFFHG